MSDKLAKEVQVELTQLEELLASHRSLLDQCHNVAPTSIERSAIAAMLHAFYTGIENILLRITVECDGSKPQGDVWHQSLLQAMATTSASRRAVLSPDTVSQLSEYLAFRHVFRHAYTFQLRWEKMKRLVLGVDDILTRLRRELEAFLQTHS